MKKFIFLIALFLCSFRFSYSQTGELDSSFGNKGIVTTDIGTKIINNATIKSIILQSDGSSYILFEKDQQTYFTKNLPDGIIDVTYGHNGFSSALPLYFIPYHAAVQPDGKVVLVGEAFGDFAVMRVNINGTADSTFSDDGLQTTNLGSSAEAYRVAIQSDGKIAVLGEYFVEVDEAWFYALARYNADGSLDKSFSKDGKLLTGIIAYYGYHYVPVAFQDNGKIVIAGTAGESDFVVAKFNSDGSSDSSFSEDGKQIANFRTYGRPTAVAVQGDGKIVVSGNTWDSSTRVFAVVRFNADGSADTTFNKNGKQIAKFSGFRISEASALTVEDNGKLILAGLVEKNGKNYFALAKYNTSGMLDKSFSEDGLQTTNIDSINDLANVVVITSNEKVLVAGRSLLGSGFVLARYNTSGNLDNTFDDDGKLIRSLSFEEGHTEYTTTAIQRDDKILAAGYIQKEIFIREAVLVRYNTNGSLDSSFSNDGVLTFDRGDIRSIALQQDGKIVVAGQMYDNVRNSILLRFNSDGSPDSTFFLFHEEPTAVINLEVMAIQSDGKIVVAGESFGVDDFGLARYNVDGSIDSTFANYGKQRIDFGERETAKAIAIQDDGKIVVAGSSYSLSDFLIARLNSDGSLDKSFSGDGKNMIPFSAGEISTTSVDVGRDGKIVAGGTIPYIGSFIVRYSPNGDLDSSFSNDGKELTNFGSGSFGLGIQTDGKIIICNSSANQQDFVSTITRFNKNGILDSSFSQDGIIHTSGLRTNTLAFENNKLYVAGSAYNGPFGGGIIGAVARYLIDGNENEPPTVNLSIPYNIVKYSAPARIKLIASAADEDGTITKVEFYNGATKLHAEDVYPYGYLWINVPVGTYTLTAKAFDDSGNVTISNLIEVSVAEENMPPVVRIVSPANDTTYTGYATIRIVAAARDPNDRISKVEFYNGTTLLRTEYYYPYRYIWSNVQPGTYTITAKAFDDKGLSATSERATITVTEASLPIVKSKPFSAKQNDVNDAISLRLSPNPASNTLHIYTKGLRFNRPSTISVVSASGTVMKTIQSNASNKVVQLDVSSLVSGVYTIKVASGDKVIRTQFVKL